MKTIHTANTLIDPDGAQIAVIEYQRHGKHGWKPHAVIAVHSQREVTYDFDWCEQDETLCYHESGSSPHNGYELSAYCDAPKLWGKLWHDPALTTLTFKGNGVTNEIARAAGYKIIRSPIDGNPFEDRDAVEGHTEYCNQCRGSHPRESMCRHLKYEEGNGYTLGCGSPDANLLEAQASLYRFLRLLPGDAVAGLLKALKSKKFSASYSDSLLGGQYEMCCTPGWLRFYLEPLGEEVDFEDRYWPGIAWLQSLDSKTPEATALTIGWLWQFRVTHWQDTRVLNNLTFHRSVPESEFDKWHARDPFDLSGLSDTPFVVKLPFKPECANDIQFLEKPGGTSEVYLRSDCDRDPRSLVLSAASVQRISGGEVGIYFGRILERDRQHISTMEGYDIVK